ncbi:Uncharacterised protein [Mycobacteroides abscessus subsp. bolletii]|nr:Uncharacterised protein [Mycobacteroides abscessus subsp. bolletii]SKS81880.1 Uncharacterised protein [Mycobacteroides abscessus subsp. bolletii]
MHADRGSVESVQGVSPTAGDIPVNLATIDDDGLGQLILRNARPGTRDESLWQAICSEEHFVRVVAVLDEMHRRNVSAIATREAQIRSARMGSGDAGMPQTKSEYRQWRSRAEKFGQRVDQALVAVMSSCGGGMEQLWRGRLLQLAAAVQAHRVAASADDVDPEPYDQALWRMLTTMRVPLGQGGALVALGSVVRVARSAGRETGLQARR